MSPGGWGRKLARVGFVGLVIVYCLFPVYFMLVQSLKTRKEHTIGNALVVTAPTLTNYVALLSSGGPRRLFAGMVRRLYITWLRNTLLVVAGSVAVTLGVAILAAYAIGRLQPRGFRWWRRAIFATYLIPQTILFVPLYQMALQLGLDDRLPLLVLVYPTMALPFCVWILSIYFQHLPREVEEAALIEGASRPAAFLWIVLPMSRSVIVAAGIFTLGVVAADVTIASVFMMSPANQTVPAGLGGRGSLVDEPLAMAGVNLLALPFVLACIACARDYVQGLTAAMVEGA